MITSRSGVSIVESLVAITILGISALGLVGLSTSSAMRGTQASAVAYRNMFLSSEFSRAMAIPAAASLAGVTCDTTVSAPFEFQRCTRVTNLTARTQRIAVVVSPLASTLLAADSLVLVRASNVGALDLSGTP